jgi:iron complex transport system substrate-binding protein
MSPRLLERPTRREVLGAGALGALSLGIAACGGGGASTGGGGGTRKVPSVNGPIEVPVAPTRVISTDTYSMATLFDLDFQGVAGVYSAGAEYVEPQYLDRWKETPKISSGEVGGEIEIEKVAELEPDLILAIDAAEPPYAKLKQIAPTVVMPFGKAQIPWSAMAGTTAEAVNQKAALAALRRHYEDKAARIKKAHAAILAKTRWSILQGGFEPGNFWLYGPGSSIGVILAAAGARFAPSSAAVPGNENKVLSYEKIGVLDDADAIYYYATQEGAPANEGPRLFEQSLWKGLPAVEAEHLHGTVYFLPNSYGDAIGALEALEGALRDLEGGKP